MLSAVTFTSMEAQASQRELKELIYSLLPEIIEKYFREREKELYSISLIERLIRVEEELKALRSETNYRFEALMREMDVRFAAQKKDSDAKFEALNARFEALMREMDARFDFLEKRFNFMQWFIGICFTIIMLALTIFNFLKF